MKEKNLTDMEAFFRIDPTPKNKFAGANLTSENDSPLEVYWCNGDFFDSYPNETPLHVDSRKELTYHVRKYRKVPLGTVAHKSAGVLPTT